MYVLTKDSRKRAKSSSISIFAHIVLFPSCLKRIVAFHFYVRGTTGWYKINEWLEEILLFSCFYDHLFFSCFTNLFWYFFQVCCQRSKYWAYANFLFKIELNMNFGSGRFQRPESRKRIRGIALKDVSLFVVNAR